MDGNRGVFLGIAILAAALLAGCGTQQQETGAAVTGQVLGACDEPIQYLTVYIPGHDPVLTDENGRFEIDGVEAPYDLVLANAHLFSEIVLDDEIAQNGTSLLVYKGLSRTDPTVYAVKNDDGQSNCDLVDVSGSISPAGEDDTYRNGVQIIGASGTDWGVFAYDSDPGYSLHLLPDNIGSQATIYGIQWKVDPESSDAAEFLEYTKEAVSIDSDTVEKDLQLTQALQNKVVSVTIKSQEPINDGDVSHYPVIDDVNLQIQTAKVASSETVDGVYSFVVPQAEGVGSLFVADGSYGKSFFKAGLGDAGIDQSVGEVIYWKRLPAGEDSLEMTAPQPVVPVVPLADSAIDPLDVTYAWSGPDGAVYDVVFVANSYSWYYFEDTKTVEVVTTDRSLKMPDGSALGFNLLSDTYDQWLDWYILGLNNEGAPVDVDDLASPPSTANLINWFAKFDPPPYSEEGSMYFVYAGSFTISSYVFPGTNGSAPLK